MPDQEIIRLAGQYWAKVPAQPTFPRNLELSVCWGYPICVITLPELKLSGVQNWLARNGVLRDRPCVDRPLRACLAAVRGQGFIFLNGRDDERERRFSLAHEIAHFILDYEQPRIAAINLFGDSIIAVLNGDRLPTVNEHLGGLLRGVCLGNFDHLVDRDPDGMTRSIRVLQAEDNADRLALELLAPRAEAMARMNSPHNRDHRVTMTLLTERLISDFGLPASVAMQYARVLTAHSRNRMTFREWIGN